MPQDSLRSAVYRSFVTCDDPKGVVECKTFRKSKSSNSKNKNHSTQQNSSISEENKDKKSLKGSKEQIMEVSKGAQKLNQVISSFSKRPSFDHKLIAQDLLKGAIDLQESLEMLGKLQEASKLITKRNNNKEKPEIMNFEKPRNSCCSSSSRDCFDELRDAITESFARQNLLPRVCSKREEDFLDLKSLDFCTDFASTSSSTSCSSSKVNQEKSKGPNLIAKLMGLEEVPSKAMIYKRADTKEEISNGRFNLLDIDLPRPRKPQFVVQKVARERRTLEEMMETMQFKGLLERKFDNGEDCSCDGSFLRNNLAVEGPPIVIMKPRHVRNYGINEERNIKSRQNPRKRSEEFPREEMKFNETNEKSRVERVSKKKLTKDKEVNKCCGEEKRKMNNCKPVAPRVQKKEVVKKIDNMAKTASDTRKQAEIKDAKSRDVGKMTTMKLKKSGNGSNAPKKTVKSNIPKKNLKKGKDESKPSEALVESIEGDCRLPPNNENDVEGSLIKSSTPEQITEGVMDASCISISADNSGNEESSPCVSSIKDDIKDLEEDSCISGHRTDIKEACKSLTDTRYLLLSNISFLNRADELFDTGKLCDPTSPQSCSLPDIEVLDAPLTLECAKEILEHKSMRASMMRNPLSQNYLFIKPKRNVSLEKLVVEICDEIEHLRNYYSKSCGDTVLGDSIYPMLERDLCSNGEVKSAWDWGWKKNGYTMEEVDELVHDVEKLVWTEIVDDVVADFML